MSVRSVALGVALIVVAALAMGACGARSGAGERRHGPEGWPRELLIGSGTGPSLFLEPGAGAPSVGYVSEGVVVRIDDAPEGDRVRVRIDGPLKVRAYVPVRRLVARVQRRGRVRGAPVYVGPNDVVGVLGGAPDGRLRIEAKPWLGRPDAPFLGPFTGTFPARGLGARELDAARSQAQAPRPGEPYRLPAGSEVPVFDRPGSRGREIARLPPLEPPLVVSVLKQRGNWFAIRAGAGPYLLGYTNARLERVASAESAAGSLALAGAQGSEGSLPARLAAEHGALYRVAAGTRVRFDGLTIGILAGGGFAREMRRHPTGEVDVFIAADDRVALRGLVRASALTPQDESALPAPTSAAPDAGTASTSMPAAPASTAPGAVSPDGGVPSAPATGRPVAPTPPHTDEMPPVGPSRPDEIPPAGPAHPDEIPPAM